MGADESTHVFDQAEDRYADLATKADLLAYIGQSHSLRGGDKDDAIGVVCLEVLHNRDVFIRGARRCVDDQIVQFAPAGICQELADHCYMVAWTMK